MYEPFQVASNSLQSRYRRRVGWAPYELRAFSRNRLPIRDPRKGFLLVKLRTDGK